MLTKWGMGLTAAALVLCAPAGARAGGKLPFTVREERPRIWIRKDAWQGPSVPRMKEWFKSEEYRKRGVGGSKELQYAVNGDEVAGAGAVEYLCTKKVSGDSPSYTGAKAQKLGAMYDWLRNHPAFTDEKRAAVVSYLEEWGDNYTRYVTGRSSAMYYSRYPGAIGGLAVIGLALYGDSTKAEGYVASAHKALLEYGRARAYEGGATAGGTYSLHHAFPDLARAVAAFESATDAGLLKYIEEKQGNWIENQLLWQVWSTYLNGYFVKEGDLWQQPDKRQVRMQVDVLTGILGNGFGRSHADAMYARWGRGDYHSAYVSDFFVFNNPDVKAEPLEKLGRAALFGRDSHGYVIFRDGWKEGNTHILFRCGEGMDVHSNKGAGAFDIYRHEVLAQRANTDYPKGDDNIIFSNAMVFNDGDHPKMEMKTDVTLDFDGFMKWKNSKYEIASIVEYEVKDEYARVKGDLSKAVRKDCKKWTRELVYLGYRYLVVLDRVETLDKPVHQKWQIHLLGTPKLEGKTVSTVNGGGKLFCRTVLPEEAVISNEQVKDYYRHVVSPKDDRQTVCIYLHVLYPTEATTGKMPDTSCATDGKKVKVTAGKLSYTFTE